MALLDVSGLSVNLREQASAHPLLDQIEFGVDAGETLAIVGESGSGKSVSALAIMGLLGPGLAVDAGRIEFQGTDLLSLSAEEMRRRRGREIAMVFQEPMTSLNPVRTIGSQIVEGIIENLGLSKAAAQDRAIQLLREVGVADPERRLRQYPHHFSGGMRQRVMIAIALSAEPKLIIADEPTTALDVTIQAQILSLLARLCRDHGTALILITHNLGIVARYAQRVNVMYGGRIVESGPAHAIYAHPAHPYTEGLLNSVPRLDQPRDRPLRPIPGHPADPMTWIDGCRFAPRCGHADDRCRQELPPFVNGVACLKPLVPAELAS